MGKNFIIYGAYGYTGELITKRAVSKGLKPILAGRSQQKLTVLAEKYGLRYIVCDLANLYLLDTVIDESTLILNCAGPFSETSQDVIEYCISKEQHYLDITGEVEVFERAKTYSPAAKEKNVMIMPGTGFDVVPSDCLAKYLSEQLPDADELELAFKGQGGSSHGTQLTMIEGMSKGGVIRKDGKITPVPAAYEVKTFDFDKPNLTAVTIPWGDISTAYHSTGIPNIKVFMAMSPKMINAMKMTNWIKPVLKSSLVKKVLRSQVKAGGPSESTRSNSRSFLVGTVRNKKGESKSARIETLDGYTLTVQTSLLIVERILKGDFKLGYQTPSSAYGYKLILEADRTTLKDI